MLLLAIPVGYYGGLALICIPAFLAVALGLGALKQIQSDHTRGKTPAWIGIVIGGAISALLTAWAVGYTVAIILDSSRNFSLSGVIILIAVVVMWIVAWLVYRRLASSPTMTSAEGSRDSPDLDRPAR